MGIDRLKHIIIEDEDIDWVESILGNGIYFDEERRDIIKNMDSVDVQAFPGSGKTTVLVAKLAILAKKWPFAHSGICVLSHTNVAREEIEDRLGKNEVGKKLLSYPHFIGTVHSFFDTYISIPWVRSKGIKINMIDTVLVQKSRWNNLSRNIRSGLIYSRLNESVCAYKDSVGKIEVGKKGPHTTTYKEIMTSIIDSHNKGNFTFDELLLYAQEALDSISSLPKSLQLRFPMLFVDEAQDTNGIQWNLIHQTFNKDGHLSVRQGYGDENQAIYNYINESIEQISFPRSKPLFITNSRRFDDQIAKLANPVALSCEKMSGEDNDLSVKQCPHTIYLFQKEDTGKVLEEFGQLVLDTFSDEELIKYNKDGCHVIGMVHDKKDETDPRHFPKGIYDYWPSYEAKKANKRGMPPSLIEYFRNGKEEFHKTGETAGQIEWIAKGLRRLINISKKENFIVAIRNPFTAIMEKLSPENQIEFRKAFFYFTSADISSKEAWDALTKEIIKILSWFGNINGDYRVKFLDWSDEVITHEEVCAEQEKARINHYRYSDSAGRIVDMQFGSIHSVKGRTHLATLVLETFSKAHNMKSILPYLCDARPKAKANSQNQSRLKCHYVAMTRARGLLCLAIPFDFVNDKDKEKLQTLGWNLKVVTK